MLPKFLRDLGLRLAKPDLLRFLEEHEVQLSKLVREELEELDRAIPEEQAYIDLKLGELGEELARAILKALKRFLREY